MNAQTRPARPTAPLSAIIQAAADVFDIPHDEIVGKRRFRPIVRARQAACKVAYEEGWSASQIARRINHKDHTTVLHARDQADIHISRDAEFYARFETLRKQARSLRGLPLLREHY